MNKLFGTHGLVLLLAACIGLSLLAASPAIAKQELVIEVAETKTIYLGRFEKVTVGNLEVVDVKLTEGRKAVEASGLQPGQTTLTVGTVDYYVVVVAAPGDELEETETKPGLELR